MNKRIFLINYQEKSVLITQKKNNTGGAVHINTNNRCLKLPVASTTQLSILPNCTTVATTNPFFFDCLKISMRFFYELLYTMSRLWYVKITFKGKGFKIKKRRRTKSIKFFFYHSHVNSIIFKKAKLKQKKKNKIIVKFWHYKNYQLTGQRVINIRGLNIFTKRGLRKSKQIVFKKTGKKSNY